MRGSIRRWPAICLTAVLATMLSACHGAGTVGGTGSNLIPQAPQSVAFAPNTLSPINIYPGEIVGMDNEFRPNDGDTRLGGRGGNVVDKIPCDATEYLNDYHVHMYLGIIYQGKQIAVPDSIGLHKPGAEQNGYITTAGCFYFIHTHDASGMIHVESPSNLPPSAVVYTLKNILDIWGMKYTATSFGNFKGTLHVFVGNVPALGQTTVGTYTKFKNAGQLGTIPIKSHEAIWIEIGKPTIRATALPPVTFYTEY